VSGLSKLDSVQKQHANKAGKEEGQNKTIFWFEFKNARALRIGSLARA
jgi:hypothetical protein